MGTQQESFVKGHPFVEGHRYKVKYETVAANYRTIRRVFVGTYLGTDYHGTTQWNLRPAGGTSQLPHDANILGVWETTEDHYVPRKTDGD